MNESKGWGCENRCILTDARGNRITREFDTSKPLGGEKNPGTFRSDAARAAAIIPNCLNERGEASFVRPGVSLPVSHASSLTFKSKFFSRFATSPC